MSKPTNQPIRLRHFLLLGFLISSLFWLLQWQLTGDATPQLMPLLTLLGDWGPAIAAMLLLLRSRGQRGVRDLWRQLLLWRVNLRWYLFALLWPPLLSLAVTALALGEGQAVPDFAHPPLLELASISTGGILLLILRVMLGALGEELGWRGLLLPLLQWRLPGLVASVILGTLWGLWQLPQYGLQHHGLLGYEFFLAQVILDAVLFTWLYNRSASLLIVVLFNTSQVLSSLLISTIPVPFYHLVLTLLPIAMALRIDRVDLGLSRGHEPRRKRHSA